uniref:Uncharacterized protein n=1 Tax=Peronospora matthiolae TaxID=2874970 RepID=A0AAV1V9T1_9STRA
MKSLFPIAAKCRGIVHSHSGWNRAPNPTDSQGSSWKSFGYRQSSNLDESSQKKRSVPNAGRSMFRHTRLLVNELYRTLFENERIDLQQKTRK